MFWETPKAMSFEEYVAKTEASIAKYMGSDEYEFKIIDHAVFNGSVEKSIACYKKSNDEYVKSSFFHLQGFYMTYCNLCRLDYPSSKAFDSSMKQLSDRFKKVMENSNDNLTFNSDGINIKDYNTVKDGLHLQICNAEKNKVYLDDKPHYDLDDLSEHIYVYEKDSRCLMNPIDKKVVINYQNPDFPWDS